MDTNKCANCGRTMNLNGEKLCVWCHPFTEEPIKNAVADRLGNADDSAEQKTAIDNWYKQHNN